MKILFLTIVYFTLAGTSFSQTWFDNSCPIKEKISNEVYTSTKSNNLLTIVLDQEGKLLINAKRTEGLSEIQFKETVYDFLTNPSKDKTKADSTKQAIIALATYGKHDSYDLVLRYIREVYLYAWDLAAKEKYESMYVDLDCKKRKKIRDKDFPYNVIELTEKEEKPKKFIGVPKFGGDVIDN